MVPHVVPMSSILMVSHMVLGCSTAMVPHVALRYSISMALHLAGTMLVFSMVPTLLWSSGCHCEFYWSVQYVLDHFRVFWRGNISLDYQELFRDLWNFGISMLVPVLFWTTYCSLQRHQHSEQIIAFWKGFKILDYLLPFGKASAFWTTYCP